MEGVSKLFWYLLRLYCDSLDGRKRMMKVAIGFIVCLGSASSAFGQIDTFNLRTKYGAPLDRETFAVRPGIEMVVDYGPGRQVCRIQLPSGKQIVGTVPPGVVTKQQVDEVLEEVVPPAIRGKEVNRMMSGSGRISFSFTEYEHVTIGEPQQEGSGGTGITVTFKDPACQKQKAQ
jgi:hypothetical protein